MTGPAERADPAAPELEVIVVSFRSKELLRRCLRSLQAHRPTRSMALRVVDNASGDGTVEMVESEFPEVTLSRNSHNLGFAAANNQVLREGTSPYVLLLNPDTQVREGTLDALLGVMDGRPRVAACGPRLVLEDGREDHAAKRSFPTPLGALGHFSGVGRRSRSLPALAQYRAPQVESGPVDAINGAFMLIRREALDQVGLFDEGYWMYMEDLDLCYRLAQAGWIVWYEPAATAVHVKAGSSGPVRTPRLNYAFHYGMHRFYRKHYAAERNPLLNLAVYAGIWLKLAVSVGRNALVRALRGPRAGGLISPRGSASGR